MLSKAYSKRLLPIKSSPNLDMTGESQIQYILLNTLLYYKSVQ